MFGRRIRRWIRRLWSELHVEPPAPDESGEATTSSGQTFLPGNPHLPAGSSGQPETVYAFVGRAETRYRAWRGLVRQLFTAEAAAGLRVSKSLSLAKLRVRSLPESMSVGGNLDLRQCQRLRRIGDGLTVNGDLRIGGRCPERQSWEDRLAKEKDARDPFGAVKRLGREPHCPLEALPEGLSVRGTLHLKCCDRLTGFPEQRRLGGSVIVERCHALNRLPDPFEVNGSLTLKGCRRLVELPASLHVSGDLQLIGTSIESLPQDLHVGGSLLLECCHGVSELPDGLEVGEDLVIRQCPVQRLPERLAAGRHLIVEKCPKIEELPAGLDVGGDIRVRRCTSLRRLPQGHAVGGSLRLPGCINLRELPPGLDVPDALDLRGCTAIASLPLGLRIGHGEQRSPREPALIVSDCAALTALPADLDVSGPIDVAGSGLTDLPPALAKRSWLLWRGVAVRPAVVFHPETLRPDEILGERNAELRRVMLERAGFEAVLTRAKAMVLDQDTDPGGVRRLLEVTVDLNQRRYLHCRCPSTQREYLLRVAPDVETCREAAAWLAGFSNPEDYRPVQET